MSSSDSTEQLGSGFSDVVGDRGRRRNTTGVSSAQAVIDNVFKPHTSPLLQSEMDGMFVLKCIFNGTSSRLRSEFCRKAGEKEGEGGKKNILSGDWELGQARNYMPF